MSDRIDRIAAELKAELRDELKTELLRELVPDGAAGAATEKAEAKPAPKPEPEAKSEPEKEAEPEPEATAEPEPEPESEPEDTSEPEKASYRNKIAQIAAGQEAGLLNADLPAVQLLALVLALAGAWAISSPALREAAGEHGGREHRRTGVRAAARLLTTPAPP